MPKKPLTPSQKQEQRILEKRREELSLAEGELQRHNNELAKHKKALEAGIFRLKDDYARHNRLLLNLIDRRKELEAQLHEINEELKAKKQELEYGTENK